MDYTIKAKYYFENYLMTRYLIIDIITNHCAHKLIKSVLVIGNILSFCHVVTK